MPVTAADIASAALGRCGAQPIISLDDPSPNARICKRFFDSTVREVISAGNWGFALTRVTLARDLVAPLWGFDFSYTLPGDVLRIVETNIPADTAWRHEGAAILTDASEVGVLYLRLVEDPTLWPGPFVQAVEIVLASKIVYAVTKDVQLTGYLHNLAREALDTARSYDGQEGTPDQVTNDTLNLVRLE